MAEPFGRLAGRLAGRVALVTGAGSGIGRATALLFAREGAAVACADLDAAAARATAAAIGKQGGRALARACDVARGAQARAAVAAAHGRFGGLHVLVCAAAFFPPTMPLPRLDEAQWDRAFAVNVGGIFRVCRHAIPVMAASGGGSIVMVASQLASVATPGDAAYCASKAALLGFARALALETAGQGIRVNTLSPGGTATPQLERQFGTLAAAERKWGRPMHPLGRLGRPDEMAQAALFLASDQSSFVTGTDLVVDGGYTAR